MIRDLHSDRENQTLTVAIIAMAERLNMNLIAKGVETKEQLDLLQKLNCKEAQGCLFGNPLSASEIREILDTSKVKKFTSV
ncbi:Oxygen sensor protein DosP [compost metagenome]